jgi:hypothetical protein
MRNTRKRPNKLERSSWEKNGKRKLNLELKLSLPKRVNLMKRLPRSSPNKKKEKIDPTTKASLMEYKC